MKTYIMTLMAAVLTSLAANADDLSADKYSKWNVTLPASKYELTVDINAMTLNVAIPALYMIGTATGGWAWGENDIEMIWNSNDGVYTYSGHLLSGELKFFREQSYGKPGIVAYVDANTCQKDELVNLSKGCRYLLAEASDGHDHKFNVTEGDYSFSVNLDDNTISVAQDSSDVPSKVSERTLRPGMESADVIYSANGTRRASLGKGINIVHKADGTAMKVVVR